MYNVANPDPNPRGGGQLPNPNECNSMLTSATRGETLTSNHNGCKSTLISGTSCRYIYTYLQNKRMRRCGVAPPTNNFRKT